jgi:hypothetical protein
VANATITINDEGEEEADFAIIPQALVPVAKVRVVGTECAIEHREFKIIRPPEKFQKALKIKTNFRTLILTIAMPRYGFTSKNDGLTVLNILDQTSVKCFRRRISSLTCSGRLPLEDLFPGLPPL